MSRIAKDQEAKWQQIESRNYAGQCKYMLNGFWETLEKDAELVWTWCQTFNELDQDKHADGNELDEFWSHKFLETLGETMTVIEMREKFRKIDADFNKRMSMVEYIMYRYSFSIPSVLTAPQGDNTEGIKRAQGMVDEAQKALDEMTAKLAAAKDAADAAKKAADSAEKAADDAKKAADAAKKAADAAKLTAEASAKAAKAVAEAEAEAKAALANLQAEEKAFEDKKAALEKTKNDMSIGVVKRNKAANELDQLLSEDPLPLRKAKINQSAAVKKCERATKAAEAAKAKADADAAAAEEASKKADAAEREAADAAQKAKAAEEEAVAAEEAAQAAATEAEKKLQEAIDFLEEEKQKGGVAQGDIWWMQREITEKKKYLPASKQK